jgi:hypothetical protein
VITLYRELLGVIPTQAEPVAEARKPKNNADYPKVAHVLYKSAAYKRLQRDHEGTGISFAQAYRDAIASRNLADPPVVKKKH